MLGERSKTVLARDGAPRNGGSLVYADGEMAACIREFAWERTSVGAMAVWPDTLVGAVNLVLETHFPTVLLWGPELVVMYNDAYMPFMAEKHPRLLGQPGQTVWSEAWHIIGPKLEATFARGERFYLENQLIPVVRQGVLKDVYWTYGYSPIRDAAGTICGVMAIAQDVTEKLAAERERDEIAASLKHVLESTTDGLATLDTQWRYSYMNEQGARMVGMRPSDVMGKVLWELFPEAGENQFGREYRRAVESGKPRHFDAYYPEPLNVWLECHCYPTEQGLSVYFRNVTEQKVTEKALRLSESRFRNLFESDLMGIGIPTRSGAMRESNDALLRLTGYTRADQEAGLVRWDVMTPPEYAEIDAAHIQEALDRGSCTPYEKEYIRKDGTRVPILCGYALVEGSGEEFVGFALDLSRQKQAEDALRKSEKLATAGRLAASIAHEINNPLEGVTNALYLALQDDALGEETKDYLKTAEQELQRVSHITTQTLRFHKQSNAAMRVDVCDIVDSVLALFKARLVSKRIEVKAEFERGAFATCFGDEIRQVVANLVSNAMDATAEGRIRLRVRRTGSWTRGRWVEGVKLVVADTGQGIPRVVVEHIFEPFITTKETTGIGLGLWVSDGIVRKHGGWIRVRSLSAGPRTGTAFLIFLPAEAQTESQ